MVNFLELFTLLSNFEKIKFHPLLFWPHILTIISTPHLVMKFPFSVDIVTIHVDQMMTSECYVTNVHMKGLAMKTIDCLPSIMYKCGGTCRRQFHNEQRLPKGSTIMEIRGPCHTTPEDRRSYARYECGGACKP